MRCKYILKSLARSGSLRFALDFARNRASDELGKLRWRGHDVFYRPGTSDATIIYAILLKRGTKAEYYLPRTLRPELILDIGSHIGASILYFRHLFPQARIVGFEPHPDTFAILQRNVSNLSGVSIFNYGLGAADAEVAASFQGSDFSGFRARAGDGSGSTERCETVCQIRQVAPVMRELGVGTVDLIKIDCEGAEYEVLAGLPNGMLSACKWIVGEMHDASGFDLLALLAPHFDIDMRRTMFCSKFRFHACNLALAPTLRGTFDHSALQT
jgi:FkbM family methyltransferase